MLLTIHLPETSFMLAFLPNTNTSQSVIDVFDRLYMTLGRDLFEKLFPGILTDRGSEFSNPAALKNLPTVSAEPTCSSATPIQRIKRVLLKSTTN